MSTALVIPYSILCPSCTDGSTLSGNAGEPGFFCPNGHKFDSLDGEPVPAAAESQSETVGEVPSAPPVETVEVEPVEDPAAVVEEIPLPAALAPVPDLAPVTEEVTAPAEVETVTAAVVDAPLENPIADDPEPSQPAFPAALVPGAVEKADGGDVLFVVRIPETYAVVFQSLADQVHPNPMTFADFMQRAIVYGCDQGWLQEFRG